MCSAFPRRLGLLLLLLLGHLVPLRAQVFENLEENKQLASVAELLDRVLAVSLVNLRAKPLQLDQDPTDLEEEGWESKLQLRHWDSSHILRRCGYCRYAELPNGFEAAKTSGTSAEKGRFLQEQREAISAYTAVPATDQTAVFNGQFAVAYEWISEVYLEDGRRKKYFRVILAQAPDHTVKLLVASAYLREKDELGGREESQLQARMRRFKFHRPPLPQQGCCL